MPIFDRTPMQEIGKRTAEGGAGLATAAHAAALQNYESTMHDARLRIADSHAFRMRNLGGKAAQVEPKPMGNILVTGDVYGDQAVQALRTALGEPGQSLPSSVVEMPTSATPKPMGTLAKAAIAAALLGSGAGGGVAVPWLMGLFNQPQPPAAVEQSEYKSGLEVSVE